MSAIDNFNGYSFNRQMANWTSPAIRGAILHNRQNEIEAFARDRKLDSGVLFGIAEAAMRLGRIPDMRQYGLATDDMYAYSHFLKDVLLNTEDVDTEEEPVTEVEKKSYEDMTDTEYFEARLNDALKVPADYSDVAEDIVSISDLKRLAKKAAAKDASKTASALEVFVGSAGLKARPSLWKQLQGRERDDLARELIRVLREDTIDENMGLDRKRRRMRADPEDAGAHGAFQRSALRHQKRGGALDLGERADIAFGEALAEVWDESGRDPLDLFHKLADSAEDYIGNQSGDTARGKLPSRIRNHKGLQNFGSRALEKAANKLGIDSDMDFSHQFNIDEYDLGEDSFEGRDGEPWDYSLTINDVDGRVSRKRGKWSVVVERAGMFDVFGQSAGDPRYEDINENKLPYKTLGGGKYELGGKEGVWRNVKKGKQWFFPDDGSPPMAASKAALAKREGEFKKSAPASSKPKLSDKGRAALHKGVCARLGKQNCAKNRMGPDKGKTGAMIPAGALKRAGIETKEKEGSYDYRNLEDYSDDDLAKLARAYKAKIRNKDAMAHMSSMEESTFSGNLGMFMTKAAGMMKRTQKQLDADAGIQNKKLNALEGPEATPEKRPSPKIGENGSVFRKAWTMDDLKLGE